jgi:hypothetical protein
MTVTWLAKKLVWQSRCRGSLNHNITAKKNGDGLVDVQFGGENDGSVSHLPIVRAVQSRNPKFYPHNKEVRGEIPPPKKKIRALSP